MANIEASYRRAVKRLEDAQSRLQEAVQGLEWEAAAREAAVISELALVAADIANSGKLNE